MTYVHCGYCGGQHPLALCPHTFAGSAAWRNLSCAYCGSSEHEARFCPRTAGGAGARQAMPAGAFLDR